ncbi:MAG: hypothetical protein JEY99_16380 [Spirochaetales bacterium]|nr:hypothetical protein [Spirochaetales bacterium]
MTGKNIILTVLILFLFLFSLAGEVTIAGETGFITDLTGDPKIQPSVGLTLSLDSYKFFNQNWSGFWDCMGTTSYNFYEKNLTFGAALGGDISFMTSSDLSRIGLGVYYEGTESSLDEYMMIEPELYFAHDFDTSTLYTSHTLSILLFPENNLTYTGILGFPVLMKSALLIEPMMVGGVSFSEENTVSFIDPSIRGSWYPGFIFYLDGEIGLKTYFSGPPVYELHFNSSLSYSINNYLQIQIMAPLILQFNEEPDEDWIFFDPQLTLNYQISSFLISSFILKDKTEMQTLNNLEHRVMGSLELTYVY